MIPFIFLCMIFCHIFDDFYLQGILAKMKQVSWWKEQTDDPLYQRDWLSALIVHGISWSFMIMLPCCIYLLIYNPTAIYWFLPIIILNTYVHCKVDNEKCNKHTINLITDQAIHAIQLGLTYCYFILLCYI